MKNETSAGDLFEIEVLGTCSNYNPDTRYSYLALRPCIWEAITLARARGWNPKNPGPELLITRLLKKIKELSIQQDLRLKFKVWSSIGTRLDHMHGIDGFFEVVARRSSKTCHKNAVYLFDISNYPRKRFRRDIDVLNRSNFEEKLEETARRILDGVQAKLS